MPIPAGSKFGPYEIVALIGAGGMGEVHRARDSRLNRDVAIKTLPTAYSADPERLRRFQHEARAAGQLSHPNVVAIFDVGSSSGQPYIVSEYLEGENLRGRLNREPVPVRKVVEIGSAVADALSAAHAQGIVHRDLKPENLFLTRNGRVKILDFGIAKLIDADSTGVGTTVALTSAGTVVGTPGYMSPEQVRGEAVDHRTDIFALGAILYELLCGRAAFKRESRIATMHAVLADEPRDLPDALPAALRRIVHRCLAKAPDDRFQSARDLSFALDALTDSSTSMPAAATAGLRRYWPIAAALAVGVMGSVAAWRWMERPAPAPAAVRRFAIARPADADPYSLALSRDGQRLLYAIATPRGQTMWSRSLDAFESTPLAGSQFGRVPFLSPDGLWFGYTWAGQLWKAPVAGGAPVALARVEGLLTGDWGEGDRIVVAQREHGLSIVSATGGPLESITTPDPTAGEIDHHAPFFLPGGRALIFTIHAGAELFRVAVKSLDTGVQKTLLADGFFARYVPTGHLLFGRGSTLWAAPFDLERLELTGPPIAVVERVLTAVGDGMTSYTVAHDGTLAYTPAVNEGGRRLVSVDRSGSATVLSAPPRAYGDPALSPDSRRLAVEIREGDRQHIWLFDLTSGGLTRVTSGGHESRPLWLRDGRHLVFGGRINDQRHLLVQPVDSAGDARSIAASRDNVLPHTLTRNGATVIFVQEPPTSITSIRTVPTDGSAPPEVLLADPSTEPLAPSASPDGRWIAYMGLSNRRRQILVRAIEGGPPRQITVDGGFSPRWSGDGTEIFYQIDNTLMRVPVRTTPHLVVGRPEPLFKTGYLAGFGPAQYDVSPDGKRFYFIQLDAEESAALPVHIVENWFEELKRLVPVRR